MIRKEWMGALLLVAPLVWAAVESGPAEGLEIGDRRQLSAEVDANRRIEALEARATGDDALQLEIEAVKREAEVLRLEQLAERCRTEGREGEALRAEAELDRLHAAAQATPRSFEPLTAEQRREIEAAMPRPLAAPTAEADAPSSTAPAGEATR